MMIKALRHEPESRPGAELMPKPLTSFVFRGACSWRESRDALSGLHSDP
jgi:hypothetical protein